MIDPAYPEILEVCVGSARQLLSLVAKLENEHAGDRCLMLFRGQTREYFVGGQPSLIPSALRPGGEERRAIPKEALCGYVAHYLSCHRDRFAHLPVEFHDNPPFFGNGPTSSDSVFFLYSYLRPRRDYVDLLRYRSIYELLHNLHTPTFVEAVLEHYGLPTRMVNVTFHSHIAQFFAFHRQEPRGNTWVYTPTGKEGIIYVFLIPVSFPNYVDLTDVFHFDRATRLHLQQCGGLFVPDTEPNYYLRYLRYRIRLDWEVKSDVWKIFQPPPPPALLEAAVRTRDVRHDYLLGFLKRFVGDGVLDVSEHPYVGELYSDQSGITW